jgi:hypothetical protein
MSKLIEMAARKLPTMLGAGILAVSLVGLALAAVGASLTIGAELVAAAAGMAVGSRYA